MFNPSLQDVRHFFCETYRKGVAREILTPLETIAFDWIGLHPEYQTDLVNLNAALEKDYPILQEKTNPFLHLALHLTIAEQVAINQPKGITPAFTSLAQHLHSEHKAHHVIMECLANMIWESQHRSTPFDETAYIAEIQKELLQIKKGQ